MEKKTCSTGEGLVCLAEAMKDLPPKLLPDMLLLLFIHNETPTKPPRRSRRREEERIQRSKGLEAEEGRREWEFPVEEKNGGRELDLRPRKLQAFDIVH